MLSGLLFLSLLNENDSVLVQDRERFDNKLELVSEALAPYRFRPESLNLGLLHTNVETLPFDNLPVLLDGVAVNVWFSDTVKHSESDLELRMTCQFRMPGARFDPVVVDAVLSRYRLRAWVDILGDLWIRDEVRLDASDRDAVVAAVSSFASSAAYKAELAAYYSGDEPVSLPTASDADMPKPHEYLSLPLVNISGDNILTLIRKWRMQPSAMGGTGNPFGFRTVYDSEGSFVFVRQVDKSGRRSDAPLIAGIQLDSRVEVRTTSIEEHLQKLRTHYADWTFSLLQSKEDEHWVNATRTPWIFEEGRKVSDLRDLFLQTGKQVKEMASVQ